MSDDDSKTRARAANRLLEGRDLTVWPSMKLQRANNLLNELHGRAAVWNASRAYLAPTRITDDRLGVDILAPEGVHLPLDEWALLLGDAFHNARSALDAIVWEFAHLAGAVPRKPNQVSFPVTESEIKWRDRAKDLESIPQELLDRVRALQPWSETKPDERSVHWLQVLSQINNDDKHRGSVAASPMPGGVHIVAKDISLGPAEGEGRFELWHSWLDGSVEPGDLIARFHFGARIEDGTRIDPAHLEVVPAVIYKGQPIPTAYLQGEMLPYIVNALEFLRVGDWPNTTDVLPERWEPADPSRK